MGDVGLMGMHVPGMSWREIRDAAVLAEELGYSCLSMGESWGEDALTSLVLQKIHAIEGVTQTQTHLVHRLAS